MLSVLKTPTELYGVNIFDNSNTFTPFDISFYSHKLQVYGCKMFPACSSFFKDV